MVTTDLIAKLQGLSAPSREVDARIAVAVCKSAALESSPEATKQGLYYFEEGSRADGDCEAFGLAVSPRYTASLDAAVALCERVLPGWKKHMWDAGVFGSILPTAAVLEPDFVRKSIKGEPYIKVDGEGPTPAIALLIALLSALEARDGKA